MNPPIQLPPGIRLWLAPTERGDLQLLAPWATVSTLPETYGMDILWESHGRLIGVQRKKFPEDFLASLRGEDDRLTREIAQSKDLDIAALVVEGYAHWTSDGYVIFGRTKFHLYQFWGLVMSLQITHHLHWFWCENATQLVQFVCRFIRWCEKQDHDSLRTRNKPKNIGRWGTRESREHQVYLAQSLDSMGPQRAAALVDHFGGLPLRWDVSQKQLQGVAGIGKELATRIYRLFLPFEGGQNGTI